MLCCFEQEKDHLELNSDVETNRNFYIGCHPVPPPKYHQETEKSPKNKPPKVKLAKAIRPTRCTIHKKKVPESFKITTFPNPYDINFSTPQPISAKELSEKLQMFKLEQKSFTKSMSKIEKKQDKLAKQLMGQYHKRKETEDLGGGSEDDDFYNPDKMSLCSSLDDYHGPTHGGHDSD